MTKVVFTSSQYLLNTFYIYFYNRKEKIWKPSQRIIFNDLIMRLWGYEFSYISTIICFIPAGFSAVIVITDETLVLLITPNVILGIHSHNTFVRKSYARLPVGCDLIWVTYQELTSVFLFLLLKNFCTKL